MVAQPVCDNNPVPGSNKNMAQESAPRRVHIAALCLGIVALGLIYHFVGDKRIWGEWISVAPPIVWVVLLLPTAFRLRSWTATGFLAGLLVTFTEWPRPRAENGRPANSVRLVSWNIGAGNTNYLAPLRAYQPDIVLIQEGMKPLEPWEGFKWYGTPDPSVLTRFPAEILPTEKVGPWTEPQLLLLDIRGKSLIVANVRLMLPSVIMQIVHPLSENPVGNYKTRLEQYGKLAKLLKSTAEKTGTRSIILAGDFNLPATMPSLDPLREFLRDAWLAAGSGWGATVPEFLPLSRVDQVWVSKDVQLLSVKAVALAGSDHRGLIVDLESQP